MYFTDQIKEHAERDVPNEACGLVFRESGVFIARPYQNCWMPEKERTAAFRVADDEVLAALKSKALVGIYHSHTNGVTDFGPADKAVAEEFNLVSYLYVLPQGFFKVYYPTGEKVSLLGRPYVPLVHDCIATVKDGFEEKTEIKLPEIERPSDVGIRGMNKGVAEYFAENKFKPVSRIRPFDVFLMMINAPAPNHCGLMLENGEFLHHMHDSVSQFDPYGGIWERCTCVIYRHEKFL